MNNILLPIHHNWLNMIIYGDKKYEFRNRIGKWQAGDVIYFYECLGKKVKCPKCKGKLYFINATNISICNYCRDYDTKIGMNYSAKVYEGSGRVLATAEIEKIYNTHINEDCYNWLVKDVGGVDDITKILDPESMQKLGYTTQKYVIKLTNIKQVDYSLAKLGVKKAPQGFMYLDNELCEKLTKDEM